jgi:hypothetical protein
MRDLRGHAVQLEDCDVLSARERVARRNTQIKPSKTKAMKSCGNVIDGALERWCQQGTRVIEACTATVAAAVAERHHLREQRNLLQTIGMLTQMKARHADRVRVFENELFERAAPITGDRWQTLLSDRQDSAARFARPAHVEHAELEAWHVLLHDRVDTRMGETSMQGLSRSSDDHA